MSEKYKINIIKSADSFQILSHKTKFISMMSELGSDVGGLENHIIEIINQSGKVIAGTHLSFHRNIINCEVFWVETSFVNQGVGLLLVKGRLGLLLAKEIIKFSKSIGADAIIGSARKSDKSLNFWLKIGCQITGTVKIKGDELYYLQFPQ